MDWQGAENSALMNVIYRHVSTVNYLSIVARMRPSTNPILLQALGAALKERRNELRLTQEDVANAAGIDRPYVTLIEAARKQPTISVLWRLAVAVDLAPPDFAARIERFRQQLQRVADAPSSR